MPPSASLRQSLPLPRPSAETRSLLVALSPIIRLVCNAVVLSSDWACCRKASIAAFYASANLALDVPFQRLTLCCFALSRPKFAPIVGSPSSSLPLLLSCSPSLPGPFPPLAPSWFHSPLNSLTAATQRLCQSGLSFCPFAFALLHFQAKLMPALPFCLSAFLPRRRCRR